jgi:glycosyltransferase involved in cell wall biosynthesis
MLAPWALRHKRWKKLLAWQLYQRRDLHRATMFHVTAESEVSWLRDLGLMQPCVLAPLGADIPDIDPTVNLRRRDIKTVLFVGRIYPVKGLLNLVKAWAAVKASVAGGAATVIERSRDKSRATTHNSPLTINGASWQLVLAGPDQAGHKAELLNEAKRLGLTVGEMSAKNIASALQKAEPACDSRLTTHQSPLITHQEAPADIIFTGPVYGADKDSLYRMADLFILPSFTENFGVVVTDALANGVPVITTKGTPWAELVTRRCGWWIDIGVAPLVETLRKGMGLCDEERRIMGENGKLLVESKFTWPAIAEQMKVAYNWLVEGGERPTCVTEP